MHYPKLIIIGIFLLSTILSCKLEEVYALDETEDTSTAEEQSDSYVIITNPNGILLYEKQFDLKSKRTVIPQGTKLYLDDAEYERGTNFYWAKTRYKKQTGFILSSFLETNYLNFSKIREETRYSLTQDEIELKELPIFESKTISTIPIYSMVPILSVNGDSGRYSINDYDFEISKIAVETEGLEKKIIRRKKLPMPKFAYRAVFSWEEIEWKSMKGYIFSNSAQVDSKDAGIEYSKKQVLKTRGYLQLADQTFNAYLDANLKDSIKIDLGSGKEILDTEFSFLINGKRFYKFDLNKLSKQLYGKKSKNKFGYYNAFVSEDEGKYFSEKEFSDSTLKNTKFKGDKTALLAMKREFDANKQFLNYIDFELKKIKLKNKKKNYYIGVAYYGAYQNLKERNDHDFEHAILVPDGKSFQVIRKSLFNGFLSHKNFMKLNGEQMLEEITGGWTER